MAHGIVPPALFNTNESENIMQIQQKRIGMVEGLGRNITIMTPDDTKNPTDESAILAVSFGPGDSVTICDNYKIDGSATLIGIDAIKHVHEALGEILRRRGVLLK